MRLKEAILATLLPAVLLTASCAVEPTTGTYTSQDRVMQAWMRHNHPGVSTYGNTSLYVIDMDEGHGPAAGDSSYVCVHYTKRSLTGDILSTNHQALAEQLGNYSVSTYYGSRIWRVDQGYLPTDLETVIKRMRSGGRVTVALPVSASLHDNSMYSAFTGTSENDNELIDLTIDTVLADIHAYQEQVMKEWFSRNYQVADTAAEHLYFKKLEEHTADTDTIPEGNNVSIRYIGRLLNGQVFDTNIEDTAKFYRIWKKGGSYDAMNLTYHNDEALFNENSSVIKGFGKAIQKMNFGEKAVTVFSSRLGYGEAGESPSIPEYAPLCFWLYIEPKN